MSAALIQIPRQVRENLQLSGRRPRHLFRLQRASWRSPDRAPQRPHVRGLITTQAEQSSTLDGKLNRAIRLLLRGEKFASVYQFFYLLTITVAPFAERN